MLQVSWYFIKIIICSGILFGYYWCFLRNKIYHQYNRFYLLISVVLSLVVPFIKINIQHNTVQADNQAIQLLEVVNSSDAYMQDIAVKSHTDFFTAERLSGALYVLVCTAMLVMFVHVLFKIRKLIYRYKGQVIEQFFFVNTAAKGTPFSFLNYIFWNDAIDIDSSTGRQIFKHEVAHIKEKHTYDKLFINLLLIVGWFNPFFWLIRKEINMIHEFVADRKAVDDYDSEAFAAMILQAAYPQHRFQLTNNFFYSPIKRRLLMLTKNKNPRLGYISRLLALPLALIVIAAFTLKTKKTYRVALHNQITVVLDAGHGGKDGGAQSLTGNYQEKDITLSIIKKIKALNTNPDINIILTRDDDTYQSPLEKVAFAKRQHADLFISVHTDGTNSKTADEKTGMTVFISKNEAVNSNSSRLLASSLINAFTGHCSIPVSAAPQQREKGIFVLQGNSCPAALLEAGYITNKKDLEYLLSGDGQQQIAENILKAVEDFNAQKRVQTAVEIK